MSDLPPGWTLDKPLAPSPAGLPPGFSLDQAPHVGTILPVTRDQSGVHFDPNAGIFGAAQGVGRAAVDMLTLPGDVLAGRSPPNDVARNTNFATFALGGSPQWAARAAVGAPSAGALRAAGGAGFDAARGMGVAYSPDAIGRVAASAQQDLLQKGLGPEVAKDTNAILDKLQKPPADPTASFDYTNGVAAVRANLQSIAQDWTKPKDQLAATRAIKALDEFVAKPGPQDVLAGPAAALGSTVKDANANWAAGARSDSLTNIGTRAGRRADAAGSGLNLDNSIRGKLASFLENPANTAGFTKSEIDLLEGIVKGKTSTNALRWFGNYLGGGGGVGAALTGFGSAAVTGSPWPLAAAVPAAVGFSAKIAENAATKSALKAAAETTRTRAPLSDARQAQAPLKSTTPAERAKIIQLMMTGIPGVSPGASAPTKGLTMDADGNVRDAKGNYVY